MVSTVGLAIGCVLCKGAILIVSSLPFFVWCDASLLVFDLIFGFITVSLLLYLHSTFYWMSVSLMDALRFLQSIHAYPHCIHKGRGGIQCSDPLRTEGTSELTLNSFFFELMFL